MQYTTSLVALEGACHGKISSMGTIMPQCGWSSPKVSRTGSSIVHGILTLTRVTVDGIEYGRGTSHRLQEARTIAAQSAVLQLKLEYGMA